MNGFMRRREQSKEDIRRAAWELFSQFGVERVTIADLSRKAGVSQATIYNNFGSKENLAREYVMSVVDRLSDRGRDVLTADKPYSEKLADFLQYVAEITAQAGLSEPGSTVLPSSVDLLNDPDIRRIRASAEDKLTSLLLGLVDEGKRQGHVDPDLTEDAFRIYFKLFIDIFADPQVQHRFHSQPKLVQDLVSLALFGLSGRHDIRGSEDPRRAD